MTTKTIGIRSTVSLAQAVVDAVWPGRTLTVTEPDRGWPTVTSSLEVIAALTAELDARDMSWGWAAAPTMSRNFITLQAECSRDALQTILRDAGLDVYANNVQPGAFATLAIESSDIAQVRALLNERGIKHGV